MKKVMLLVTVAMLAMGCMAQMSNVKKAKSKANAGGDFEAPDFEGARALIGAAFEDESTKDLTDTWYVAGLIGFKQNRYWYNQAYIGNNNIDARGQGAMEAMKYWPKAAELAQVPNEKGKIDNKTLKDIQNSLVTLYTDNQELAGYSINMNDQKDYKTAYDAMMLHLSIPDLPFMQDPKLQEKLVRDTTYYQYKFYAALFAIQSEMHAESIDLLSELKAHQGEEVASVNMLSVYQFLIQEYQTTGDTLASVAVMNEASNRFPSEPWFIQNLINYHIFHNRQMEAIGLLEEAIKRDPTVAQYYHIKGNLEEDQKMYDAALADFEKALSVDPKLADAAAGMGRVYYNQAVAMNEKATDIQDNKAYNKALQDVKAMFAKSLPFFEKAHELDKANNDGDVEKMNRQYMIILRGLYHRLGMTEKEEAMDALINQ